MYEFVEFEPTEDDPEGFDQPGKVVAGPPVKTETAAQWNVMQFDEQAEADGKTCRYYYRVKRSN